MMIESVGKIEGVGEEVVLSSIFFTLFLLASIYIYMRQNRGEQVNVHPTEQDNINQLRATMGEIPPRRRFNHESQCPVCLGDINYEIETNCGHCFCARCWIAYRSHGSFLGVAHCPVCRQEVTILFIAFTEEENAPIDDSEVTRQRQELLDEINNYNRRFSGEPRPLLDYLRDLPTLSRHLWNEFFTGAGLLYMFRLRVIMCLLAGVVYLISPLDIVPEAVFGILGLMDDIFVLLVICVYISMFYRSYIAGRS